MIIIIEYLESNYRMQTNQKIKEKRMETDFSFNTAKVDIE